MMEPTAEIERIEVAAFTVPTDGPEADGTLQWNATSLVLAKVHAAGNEGIGYSYTARSAAGLVHEVLAPAVVGRNVCDIAGAWHAMRHATRNLGGEGICATAIAAVDIALWDCKAKLLGLPLALLLGRVREGIPVYGSGGFTNYSPARLRAQMEGWAAEGFQRVKLKIGRDAAADIERVEQVRQAVGHGVEIFVDANGGYTRKLALAQAERFAPLGVTWFEEPVSSDDLDGLHLLRDRMPGGIDVAAGEYGYNTTYFQRMLAHGAVDVLQADATRCLGISGFLQAAVTCAAHGVPLSSHCAPALHVHLMCAAQPGVHLEYFYDHTRIEQLLFAGVQTPKAGVLYPDLSRPGLGLEVKRADAQRFAA